MCTFITLHPMGKYIKCVLLLLYTLWEGTFNVYFYYCPPYGKVHSMCTFIIVHPMGRYIKCVLLLVYTLWKGTLNVYFY